MKSADEYYDTALVGAPFSNSTDSEIWFYNVCRGGGVEARRCVNDDDEFNPCPLITLAVIGQTPAEWVDGRTESGEARLADRCTEKTTPAEARRAAREAQEAAERAALEASHYPMFPAEEVP
ncbi:hypothetical protein [Nocardia pseudovaccinii]|uniref:hypothetical protein n=1 Tax=Nocardia pseudovaccinii TaxID=189540 RepID=UPI0007A3BCC6|nr:hypothetical protein [Nocardia pseudovaccinii]